jgi:hypothetical protein
MSQFTPNLSGRVGDGGDRTAVHHEQPRGSIVFQDRRGRRARDLNSIRGKGGRVDVNLQGPLHDQIGLLAALRPHERVLVLLQLLGGQQRVELARSAIEAIE